EGRLAGLFDPRQTPAGEVAAAALPLGPGAGEKSGREADARPSRVERRLRDWGAWLPLREAALLVLLVLLFAVAQALGGQLLSSGSLENLASDTALLGFCALGAALVLLAGGIDISLGSQMALSAGVAGWLWEGGWPLAAALPVAAAVGGVC